MVAFLKLAKIVAVAALIVGSNAANGGFWSMITNGGLWSTFTDPYSIGSWLPNSTFDYLYESHKVSKDDDIYAKCSKILSKHPTAPIEVETVCEYTPDELIGIGDDKCGLYINQMLGIYGVNAEIFKQALLKKRVDPGSVKLQGRMTEIWRGDDFPKIVFDMSHPDAKRADKDVRQIASDFMREKKVDEVPSAAELVRKECDQKIALINKECKQQRKECKQQQKECDKKIELSIEESSQQRTEWRDKTAVIAQESEREHTECEGQKVRMQEDYQRKIDSAFQDGVGNTLMYVFVAFIIWKVISSFVWTAEPQSAPQRGASTGQ